MARDGRPMTMSLPWVGQAGQGFDQLHRFDEGH